MQKIAINYTRCYVQAFQQLAKVTLLCTVLTFLNLKFNVTQYRWGRKLYKGTWYYIDPRGLSMCSFWSDTEITSCQSQTLGIERY